jgi:hypothetical protein
VSEPLSVLYVAGSGRSGSTLLDLLLGSLPGVLSLGEFHRLWHVMWEQNRFCGCGEPLQDCPVWREVVGKSFGGFDAVDWRRYMRSEDQLLLQRRLLGLRFPRLLGQRRRNELDEVMDVRARLYREAALRAGATMVVDSSKRPSYALALRRAAGLDVRVVHLVRDSRPVAHSWSNPKPHPRPGKPESMMRRIGPGRMSVAWSVEQFACEALVRPALPTLRVRYEDLAREPETTVRRILRFAGRPELASSFSLENIAPFQHHTIGGNPIRFEKGPLTVQIDERWRQEMPAGQRRAVTALTWPLLAAYGYLGPRRQRHGR